MFRLSLMQPYAANYAQVQQLSTLFEFQSCIRWRCVSRCNSLPQALALALSLEASQAFAKVSLAAAARHTSHVTRHASHVTLPPSQSLNETSAVICNAAGIGAMDELWALRRAAVGGVYAAAELHMLSDTSAGYKVTCVLCFIRHTSHVTCHTSHVTRHLSHVITRHTLHVTRHHMSHITRRRTPATSCCGGCRNCTMLAACCGR